MLVIVNPLHCFFCFLKLIYKYMYMYMYIHELTLKATPLKIVALAHKSDRGRFDIPRFGSRHALFQDFAHTSI